MHLVVDVDGVLADQVPPVLDRINEKYGLGVRKKHIKRWDQAIADTDIKVEIESSLLDPEFVLGMRLIRDARRALVELAKSHHITIATNRDPSVDEFTKEWLQKKGIPFDDYVNTKKEGKGAISGHILVDDYPKNLIDFSVGGRLGILFTQPWNENDDSFGEAIKGNRLVRARGWDEVVEIIKSHEWDGMAGRLLPSSV